MFRAQVIAMAACAFVMAAGCSGQKHATDLGARLDAYENGSSRVTYRQEVRVPGEETRVNGSTETRAPGNRVRYDVTPEGESDGRSPITIINGKEVIECDPRSAFPSCNRVEPDTGNFSTFSLRITLKNAQDADPAKQTIAGEAARCYVGDNGTELKSTVCLAEDGVVLLKVFEQFADNGAGLITIRFEAVEVSRDVDESVFDPPYPVDDSPTIPITAQ